MFQDRMTALVIGISLLLSSHMQAQVDGETQSKPQPPSVTWVDGVKLIDGIPEGYMLIEGDIMVPEGFYEFKAVFPTNTWPNNIIPYRFDANMTAANQTAALNAMTDWQDETAVNFLLRTTETDFIHIRNSGGDANPTCSSAVGVQTGQQILNITTGCLSIFSIHHELAHAMGFWHEQSAFDRDTYVTINLGNVQAGAAGNFDIQAGAGVYGPYDFDSVMHYGQFFFSTCNLPGAPACTAANTTIDVNPPWDTTWQALIGQRDHLSVWDRNVMSYLYAEPTWRFLDTGWGGTTSGTFLQPWNTSINTAIASTPTGGELLVMRPANLTGAGTTTKAITLRAPIGGVVFN
jgi:hypothetical protein